MDCHDIILRSSVSFFFLVLYVCVSEREMRLHVFSRQVALIHPSPVSITAQAAIAGHA